MQAVVLAAGKGERLWPLTERRPKPMMPVANRPLLAHIVDELSTTDITDLILVVGSNRQRVQSYFQNGQKWDIDISYVVQQQQLGTGHALLQAEPLIGDSFIALNGDRIIRSDLVERVWERHQETSDTVVSVTRVDEPSRYGVVALDGRAVAGIEERPVPEFAKSDFINAGVYAFAPDIFSTIRQTESRGEQALTDALSNLISDQDVRAVQYRGIWLDVSEPWDLLEVNGSLIAYEGASDTSTSNVDDSAVVAEAAIVGDDVTVHPQSAVLQGTTLGDNVSVGPGAVLENTVVLQDATIRAGVVLQDCIIGANSTIGPNTTIEGGSTDVVLNDTVYNDVIFGGLLGDNVDVGGNVTVEPGTIIGNDATIGSAALVSGRVDDDATVTRG